MALTRAWTPRKSGILERVELPDLTVEAAITRSWELRDGARLMTPVEQFLPTYPLVWEFDRHAWLWSYWSEPWGELPETAHVSRETERGLPEP